MWIHPRWQVIDGSELMPLLFPIQLYETWANIEKLKTILKQSIGHMKLRKVRISCRRLCQFLRDEQLYFVFIIPHNLQQL